VQTPPFLGDTTSNQAFIFSAPFTPSVEAKPTYPNYTLPPANLSAPAPPSSSPNFTLVVAPSSSSLPSLPQTACMLSAQRSTGTVRNQSLWLRDEEGWRSQWLLEGLSPATNYTAYVIQDSRKVSGPMYFVTKSGTVDGFRDRGLDAHPFIQHRSRVHLYSVFLTVLPLPTPSLYRRPRQAQMRTMHPTFRRK
jgi:hypothetical protein